MAQPIGPETYRVVYSVPRQHAAWELSEEKMPESIAHDEAVALLKAILAYWALRHRPAARVARNLAVRWDERHPAVGVDPDVCVLDPAPPDADALTSVKTWETGHAPPSLAIEVVSDSNPRKDYVVAPDKYAASGIGELWIFDPLLCGPKAQGGPHRLQLWQRRASGELVRTYAGAGPVASTYLDAYLVVDASGRLLRVADDPAGACPWPTAEEAERAAKEAERTAKEAERAAKEAALARVAELEALLRTKKD